MWLVFIACIIFLLESSGLEHCRFWGRDHTSWEWPTLSTVPFACSTTGLGDEPFFLFPCSNQCRSMKKLPTTLLAFILTYFQPLPMKLPQTSFWSRTLWWQRYNSTLKCTLKTVGLHITNRGSLKLACWERASQYVFNIHH